MILGHSELRKLIRSHKLITGLSERDKENPVGSTFDLQLDKVYELKGEAYIGIEERETPKYLEVASYNPKRISSFIFKPGKYHVVKTVEEVNLPKNVSVIFVARTTLIRSGLVLNTGIADPGYKGSLHFGIKNEGNSNVVIDMGARFAIAIFLEVKGKPVNLYKGGWQGGRATTKKREKQI